MHAKGIYKLIADPSCFCNPSLQAFLRHLGGAVSSKSQVTSYGLKDAKRGRS